MSGESPRGQRGWENGHSSRQPAIQSHLHSRETFRSFKHLQIVQSSCFDKEHSFTVFWGRFFSWFCHKSRGCWQECWPNMMESCGSTWKSSSRYTRLCIQIHRWQLRVQKTVGLQNDIFLMQSRQKQTKQPPKLLVNLFTVQRNRYTHPAKIWDSLGKRAEDGNGGKSRGKTLKNSESKPD